MPRVTNVEVIWTVDEASDAIRDWLDGEADGYYTQDPSTETDRVDEFEMQPDGSVEAVHVRRLRWDNEQVKTLLYQHFIEAVQEGHTYEHPLCDYRKTLHRVTDRDPGDKGSYVLEADRNDAFTSMIEMRIEDEATVARQQVTTQRAVNAVETIRTLRIMLNDAMAKLYRIDRGEWIELSEQFKELWPDDGYRYDNSNAIEASDTNRHRPAYTPPDSDMLRVERERHAERQGAGT